MRLFRGGKARAAEDDDGVFDALRDLLKIRLEHFELEADAACFASEQKLRIGKRQPVGVGLQRRAVAGMRVQFGPGVGEAAAGEIVGLFHVGVAIRFRKKGGVGLLARLGQSG